MTRKFIQGPLDGELESAAGILPEDCILWYARKGDVSKYKAGKIADGMQEMLFAGMLEEDFDK